MRQRLADQPNQDELKARFLLEQGEDGFRVGDFKRRGWESLVCGSALREFATSQFGWVIADEATFYSDNKLDLAALEAANAEMEKSCSIALNLTMLKALFLVG